MTGAAADRVRETFIVDDHDWIEALTGPVRHEVLDLVRGLPLQRVRRFPPRKEGAIPLGHEWRVFRRFAAGESTLFDPSAFAALYRRAASPREQLLFRAFAATDILTAAEWSEAIGASAFASWRGHDLLREDAGGFWCRFGLYSIGTIVLFGDAWRARLLRRVVVGQDSFSMAEFMAARQISRARRYLDVGPGSGVVLLSLHADIAERVGIDINPRAVAITALNAELNRLPCAVHLDDAIANGSAYGAFDLVTWNAPFVHLPPECKDTHYDAYGGAMGMEIPLQFMRTLPMLLAPGGRAFVAAASPIMKNGDDLLAGELVQLAAATKLDIRRHVTQSYWHTLYRDFQDAQGIRRFEHAFLELAPGRGRVERIEAPIGARLSDKLRELVFAVRR